MSSTTSMQLELSRSSKGILRSLGDVNPIPPKMEVSAAHKDATQDSRIARPPSPQVALPQPRNLEADLKHLRRARHSLNDAPSKTYLHVDAVGPPAPDKSLRTQSTGGPFQNPPFTSEVVSVDQILARPPRNSQSRGPNADVVPVSESSAVQPGAQNRTISGRRFSRTNFITNTLLDESSETQQAPPSTPPTIPPLPGVVPPLSQLQQPPSLNPAAPIEQTPARSCRPSFTRTSSSLSLPSTPSNSTLPRILTAQSPLPGPQPSLQTPHYPVPPPSPRSQQNTIITRRSQPSPAPLVTAASTPIPGGAVSPASVVPLSPMQSPITGVRSRSRLSAVCENGTSSHKPSLATRSQRNIIAPTIVKGEPADGMTIAAAASVTAVAGAAAAADIYGSDDEGGSERHPTSGRRSYSTMLRNSDAGSASTNGGGGGIPFGTEQIGMSQREKGLRRTGYFRSTSIGREPLPVRNVIHSEGGVSGGGNRHQTQWRSTPNAATSLPSGPGLGTSADAWGKWEGASTAGGGLSSVSASGRNPQASSSNGMDDPDWPGSLPNMNYMLNSAELEGPEVHGARLQTEWMVRSTSPEETSTVVRHLSGSGVEGEVTSEAAGAIPMRPISALRRRYRVSASGDAQWGVTERMKYGSTNGILTGSRTRFTRSLSGVAALAARRTATVSLAGIAYMNGHEDEDEDGDEDVEEVDENDEDEEGKGLVHGGQVDQHCDELAGEMEAGDSGSHSSSLELSDGLTLVPGLSSILDPILDELDPRRQQNRLKEQRLKQNALGAPRVVETWADSSGGGSSDPSSAATPRSARTHHHQRPHAGAGGMLAALAEKVLKLPCVGLDKLGDPEKRQRVIQRLREKGGSVFQVQILSRTPQFRDRWCN